jgi:non-specific serine/threonine protein kinase
MSKELNAVIMPTGLLELEWSETEEPVDNSRRMVQEEVYKRFQADPEDALLFLGFSDKSVPLSLSLGFWRSFAGRFAKKVSLTPDLESHRRDVEIVLEKEEAAEFLDSAPWMAGSEYLNRELLKGLWDRLNEKFRREAAAFKGTVEELIRGYSPNIHLVGRVYFHLVENKSEDLPFAFLATYSTSLDKEGKSRHLPLKYALQEYGKSGKKMLDLLSTVHLASRESPLIADLLESGELFHPLAWEAKDAFTFLKEIPLYEKSGILCRIPNWWKGEGSGLRVHIRVGDNEPSYLGMDAILQFNAELLLGDTPISPAEAKKLLQASEGLAYIKNKWVAVDPEKLRKTLEAYERAQELMGDGEMSIRDAFRLQLHPLKTLHADLEEDAIRISNGQWLESVFGKLRNPELISSVQPGKAFKAELRPYQQRGLNWLYFLHSLGFGACLADDMGLGKTIQLLAFLNVLKSNKQKGACLLVIPASLLSNWMEEIARFSPDMVYYVAHPSANKDNKTESPDKKFIDGHDLVITTYSLVQRYEWVQNHGWNYIILDEAQAIKNPNAKQTKALKKLTARNRIIMSGTPIENRLSDLWSLFDFLNPGLMGSAKEFADFSKGLKKHPEGYSRLRKIIGPYILRRLKTDKSVISDLPEKVEMKVYASLSARQILLYKKMVLDLEKTLEDSEGIQRKGIILASLMKLKQLCNHPDQYLGTGGFEETESGKFERLREIAETIHEKREKVLVFTQFKEMTEPLKDFLEGIFKREGLVLHGSIPVGKRKKIIEDFQSQKYFPFLVLSLKAGGVGLNLTEANHVIHFDRWWNPAVENQATDRAFRIGQKKNVVVHKFVTQGTIEEKIDAMLRDKSRMSEEVIQSSGDSWITEMDNKKLMDLFKLSL